MSSKVCTKLLTITRVALLSTALPLLVQPEHSAYLAVSPALAQTQYEWVPGSRQARAVPSGQARQLTPQQLYQQQRQYQYQQQLNQQQQNQQQGRQTQTSASQTQQVYPRRQPQAATTNVTAGQAPQKGKSYHFVDSVMVDGVQRHFQVHVPPGYDRNRPLPVVLIFHGLQMNSTMMVGMTGFNPVSDHNNFIAVYGEGVNNRWSDGRTSSGVDDVAYVTSLLDKLAKEVNIDRRRVYACGISNGGFFAQVLACTIPDKIAAAGVVASTMMDRTQGMMQGSKAVPIVFFLGTDDPLLPWADGRNKDIGKLGEALGLGALGSIDNGLARMGGLITVPETIAFWTAHNNCSGNPQVTQEADRDARDGTTVRKESYGSSSNQVVLYTIEGGGHTWPGCPNLSAITGLTGKISQDIDASSLMWEFFKTRSR
jgi:polyhydroxybutyrate depolymerase